MNDFVKYDFQIFFNLAAVLTAGVVIWNLRFNDVPDVRFALMLTIFNIALLGISSALRHIADALPKKT